MIRYTDKDPWNLEETMELFEDRVVVTTVKVQNPPVASRRQVPVAGLQPAPVLEATTHWPYRRFGVVAFLGLAVVLGGAGQLVATLFGKDAGEGFGFIVGAPIVLATMWTLYSTKEPLFRAKYEDVATKSVMLTITCRRERDRRAFEQFVDAVSERIRQRAVHS